MRRKDREVTDMDKIEEIIKQCHVCRVGFNDNGKVYIVPLNFGYEIKEGRYILYFHSARHGRKIDLMEKSQNVGFEMDTGYELVKSEKACGHSALYKSIIGNGVASMIHGDEKIHGLRLLMEHETNQFEWNFDKSMLDSVAVFKIDVTELSCKEH